MEKTRLQNEKQSALAKSNVSKKVPPPVTATEKNQNSVPITAILSPGSGKKETRAKSKEPEFFTATVASDKKKN